MRVQSEFRKWTTVGALGFGAALLGGLLVSGGASHLSASASVAPATTAAPRLAPSPGAVSYADAVDRAAPAVVTIQFERKVAGPAGGDDDDLFQRFFGQNGQMPRRAPQQQIERGLGSGVIVSADGNIVTNNHVVDGSQTVSVTLADGREFTGKVLGKDAKTDLAVVHIDAKNLPSLVLGDSDRVRVGDVVLAVGNPLGVGETVTMGIISAKGRTTDLGEDGSYEDFLQTDAPINQGNSGGALITAGGELVGINSQIMSPSGGNIGIGFAIPSDMVKNVMTQLVDTGHVRRGMLGVTVQPITSDLARSLGLPSVHGALVGTVTADSPAASAGVKPGDVILDVNGVAVNDSNDLRNRISEIAPGQSVTLTVQRDGATRTMTARLGEVSENQAAAEPRQSSENSTLGLTVAPLTAALADQYKVPQGVTGLVVTNVAQDSAASRAGIQTGDVIRTINGESLRSAADLTRALSQRSDRPALAYVQRGDRAFYAALPRS